ncbi:hypothetical protein [Paenibacillus rhizolycopersici]|uniref:hypothetical protein n=1 Tax=Paenibacillus rhizolycopersici TaxID=2780073 RepID=UPI003D27FD1C
MPANFQADPVSYLTRHGWSSNGLQRRYFVDSGGFRMLTDREDVISTYSSLYTTVGAK